MKELIIKSIRFVNFKGLRDLTIDFPAKNIDIKADNGVGKSSIQDGFTWVFFGKDRKDRKQFGIKTYDSNNKVIPRIPHEVEILLVVRDSEAGTNQEVRLTRRYNEKWVREKGSPTEEFKGHEEERLYNDVPCSLKEWNEKIAELCSEDVFKFITNPLYFSSQKTEVQREMLIRMAGGVSIEEIAAGNKDFTKLLANLTGKTIDEYKKEIAAKKKRIKGEIDSLPGAIAERRRDIVQPEDWQALETEREKLVSQRSAIMAQLSDKTQELKVIQEKAANISTEINRTQKAISERTFAISQEITKKYREQVAKRNELIDERNNLNRRLSTLNTQKEYEEKSIENCTSKRTELLAEFAKLDKEAKRLAREMAIIPQINESELKCPTCGHPYDYDVIEQIESNHAEQHRKKYASLLADNAKLISENQAKGQANNRLKQSHADNVANIAKEIEQTQNRIKEIEETPLYINAPVEPDTAPEIAKDSKLIELNNQLTTLKNKLNNIGQTPDDESKKELENNIGKLNHDIEVLSVRLSKREDIEKNNKRIAQLEQELRNNNDEMTELEGIEFTIQAFSKARIEAVEKKINSLFSIVKFKMFDTQVNGAEVETCEATLNGVPFGDLNDAGRINAGLDIINAICKFEGIAAPIFIDNAEGINRPLETISQRIRLIVTYDPDFVITGSDNNPRLF